MTCPDENLFAKAQAHQLTADEETELHKHFDVCPSCLLVASVLGCVHEADAFSTQTSIAIEARPGRVPDMVRRRQLFTYVVLLMSNVHWSYVFVPLVWKQRDIHLLLQLGTGESLLVESALTMYTLLWGIFSACWGALVLIALAARWRWARIAGLGYAVLSIPTIALAPLSLYVLIGIRGDSGRCV